MEDALPPVEKPDPVLIAAGDIARCNKDQDEQTAQLVEAIPGTVVTLGDHAYPNGTIDQFKDCYDPSWGRFKDRTYPVPGNHDYHTAGATAYYTYFGSRASPQEKNCTKDCKGYYSYDLGAWHIIALNSEIPHNAHSDQVRWLLDDLATHPSRCTLAYWHKPRFGSGNHGDNAWLQPFWQALYDHGADVVLNGHNHTYERFAPQTPDGEVDPERGIREFIVGTGGGGLTSFPRIEAASEVHEDTSWGVLKLTLHPTSYDWEFIPTAGGDFHDAGSADCVAASLPQASTQGTSLPFPAEPPLFTPLYRFYLPIFLNTPSAGYESPLQAGMPWFELSTHKNRSLTTE